MKRFLLAVLYAFLVPAALADEAPNFRALSGHLGIHDPSVIYVKDGYVAFSTGVERAADGGAIRIKTSDDGIKWQDRGTLGTGLPDWVAGALGQTPPNLWAPSVSLHGTMMLVYYAASTFGKNLSAIGLTTNAAFDPENPGAGWQDRGVIFKSRPGDNFNAIDPMRFDDREGRAWLAFGSWWDGIKMIELDAESGTPLVAGNAVIPLASRGSGAIEAPALLEHDGRYYLFVSFGHCCRGVASDYTIRVGRADRVAGPYLDREGRSMLAGGGTLVLESTGRHRGPGGQETFRAADGADMLAFHYYDSAAAGAPKLQIEPIGWDDAGWPMIGVGD